MKAQDIIGKLLRGEPLSETEIGLFLVDTSDSERIHEEVFKRRGAVAYVRTVKRVRGKLYETLWERTATDCAYPQQPYEIKDNPYWQSLTNKSKKPVFREDDAYQCELNHCPTCGHIVEGVESGERFAYCPQCGQRIDWEGAERDALGGKESA